MRIAGIECFPVWVGHRDQRLGPGPVLGIDFHHRLSLAEAASFCARLP